MGDVVFPMAYGEPFVYPDGSEVLIRAPRPFTPSSEAYVVPGFGEEIPAKKLGGSWTYVVFEVSGVNRSGREWRAIELASFQWAHEPDSQRVFAPEWGDDPINTEGRFTNEWRSVPDGGTYTYYMAFAVDVDVTDRSVTTRTTEYPYPPKIVFSD